MVQPINGQTWLLERNPYFWAVDTRATSCPTRQGAADAWRRIPRSSICARSPASTTTWSASSISPNCRCSWRTPTRGKYKVHLDPGFNGADSELKFNFAYRLDPEIQKWFANLEFRRALALGIDREQINEAFFLGLGVTGTPIPADIIPAKPRQGLATALGHARRREGQRDAGCDRPEQEGRRGLPRCAPTTASACACRSTSRRRCRRPGRSRRK